MLFCMLIGQRSEHFGVITKTAESLMHKTETESSIKVKICTITKYWQTESSIYL